MKCPICDGPQGPFGKALILRKHEVDYYRCDECGFVQTQEPTWLNEAYSEAIAASDIGLIGRNLFLSKVTHAVLAFCLKATGTFLDFGGGYGIFTRLMRDRGFEFFWEDPMCVNLFAKGFEAAPNEHFAAVTAFEVFEHLPEPVNGLEQMLRRSDRIFFSTELLPHPTPKPGDWWYYALECGQHVSFHTEKSLEALGRRLELHFYSNGRSLHLYSKSPVSRIRFKLACSGRLATSINRFYRLESLLTRDHEEALKRLR